MSGRTQSASASAAFHFVLAMGIVNLFGDTTYEGGASINGPFLGSLGASAAAVNVIAGFGEFFGYSLRSVAGYLSRAAFSTWLGLLSLLIIGADTSITYASESRTDAAVSPFASAADQAGRAADAKQLSEVHERLQYVLNCLEGAKGRDYRETSSNPCSGKGALQTLPEKSANRIRAGKAIILARVGITFHDFPPAHYVAQAIRAILTEDKSR